MSQLTSIQDQMATYWPSLMGGHGNDQFWSHEWSKHGTCSTLDSQLDYFSRTLTLRQNLQSFHRLAAEGIVPGGEYSADAIDKVFADLKATPLLGCDRHSFSVLQSIGFCYDKNLNIIDCDASVKALGKSDEVTNCDRSKPIVFKLSKSASPIDPAHLPEESSDDHPLPSRAPSHVVSECLPAKAGPPCKADEDCAGISGCVRCAHSGFCTMQAYFSSMAVEDDQKNRPTPTRGSPRSDDDSVPTGLIWVMAGCGMILAVAGIMAVTHQRRKSKASVVVDHYVSV